LCNVALGARAHTRGGDDARAGGGSDATIYETTDDSRLLLRDWVVSGPSVAVVWFAARAMRGGGGVDAIAAVIPGSYASYNLYGAYQGWPGYDYSQVPSWDD
jgi:hypothetical protein